MSAATIDSPTAILRTSPIDQSLSGHLLLVGHQALAAQTDDADQDPTPDQGPPSSEAQEPSALVGPDSGTGAEALPAPKDGERPSLDSPLIYNLAATLDDIEGLRKAQSNRLRILTREDPDEDGVIRGFALAPDDPAVSIAAGVLDGLAGVEHQAVLALNRAMRKHPLNEWRKTQKGVGEKQLARLLASIGDPYINATTGRSRTVSQLWAYSGLHTLPTSHSSADAQNQGAGGAQLPAGTNGFAATKRDASLPGSTYAAKRQKGVRSNWSTDAKTRAWLIAVSCIKQDGEYRGVYDARRAHTAQTHPEWTPGHSHNDALRIVSKRILRDLWRAARNYHEGTES